MSKIINVCENTLTTWVDNSKYWIILCFYLYAVHCDKSYAAYNIVRSFNCIDRPLTNNGGCQTQKYNRISISVIDRLKIPTGLLKIPTGLSIKLAGVSVPIDRLYRLPGVPIDARNDQLAMHVRSIVTAKLSLEERIDRSLNNKTRFKLQGLIDS